jgi:aspartate carbamoyltransferase catalytic subunit
MKQLLTVKDLNSELVFELFALADEYLDVAKNKGTCLDVLKGKVLAALFYEPSTRTRLSTETAMLRLGGKVINAVGIENSSLKKGETLYDTAQMITRFADVIAIRHSEIGSAAEIARGSTVPVINCGDGPANHPTQSLLDAYTIFKEYGRLDNLKIAFVGDLKFSRTSHSLLELLNMFSGNQVVLCSPEKLKLGEEYNFENLSYKEDGNIESAIKDVDVIYASRVQKERFDNLVEYEKLKDYFVFTLDLLEQNCPNGIIMHALPRIDEILPEVDQFQGARYFEAVTYGVAIRMALLTKLLT